MVKRSADKWHAHVSDHVAFYSYRWLAWAVAALTFSLPGHLAGDMPRDAALLLMLLLVNVALTALAYGYVRLVRRRPALLALDLLFGSVLIWMSGGAFLPYLPYALGALLLPALTFGWRGALLSSLAFVALDFAGITLLAADGPADLTGLTARALVPFAFSFCWAAIAQFMPRSDALPGAQPPSAPSSAVSQARVPGNPANTGDIVRVTQRTTLERGPSPSPANNSLGAAPAALARPASASPADPARRVIYELTPGPQVALPTAIELLVARFGARGGLSARVAVVGASQPLNAAQHSVLLRATQEALLNIQQHARARNAQITLTFEPRAVTLVIQDDGVGLLDGTYERPGLHALRALRYRIAELDGQLAVFEGESGGVTLRATLPLE